MSAPKPTKPRRGSQPVAWRVDETGMMRPVYDTAGMMYPMRCLSCGCVHDASKEPTVARYADCSMWKCPGCGRLLDDRPARMGGTERL